ncbi:hypothetical protein [Trichloromonas sp.]|uniref:hypothetical protein n=1 Tax=Trichloromonas sp. TaxID=3069249 RepID=UPI003D81A962
MKFVPLLLIAAVISTGCASLLPRPAVQDEVGQQEAFLRFVDAETATGRKQALRALQREYPQGPLTSGATRLEAARLEQLATINKSKAELKRCQKETTQLESENAALRKDLDQLKQLVIEMEMRAR